MTKKFVCSKHFKEEKVKAFVSEKGAKGTCSYCKRKKKVVSIKDLAEHIEELAKHEYGEPYASGAMYDKETDDYPFIDQEDTITMLERELEVDKWDIIEDLSNEFENDNWCVVDGMYGPTEEEYLSGGWDEFKDIIKHKIRFVFFNPLLKDDFSDRGGESLNPYMALEEVKKSINELDLYTQFEIGQLTAYRGRQHSLTADVSNADHLGSPPVSFAKANRMSPPGIPMFYGALDEITSQKEIEDIKLSGSRITIGRFSNLRTLSLVDFTKLKDVPSLFDEEGRHKRTRAKFLKAFIEDLSIPVKPDDSVHVDYVPTQVVTEYIRLILGKEKDVNGIMYNSVKNPGGVCVVLFLENRDACDKYPVVHPPDEFDKFFGTTGSVIGADPKDWATLIMDNHNLIIIDIP